MAVVTVSGFVSGINQWGQISIVYPRCRGEDSWGTEAKLSALGVESKGEYRVRPTPATLFMRAGRRCRGEDLVQHDIIAELRPIPFDYTASGGVRGISLQVVSMRTRSHNLT